nr:MAG TPA: hypothetical protein [Caudoviricetes sp.]
MKIVVKKLKNIKMLCRVVIKNLKTLHWNCLKQQQ